MDTSNYITFLNLDYLVKNLTTAVKVASKTVKVTSESIAIVGKICVKTKDNVYLVI